MHLLDKLEKLGLDDVSQSSSSVSPTTLRVALENLTYANGGHLHDIDETLTIESNSPMRRNLSNSSMEAVSSPKMSPMHRSSTSSSVGLNMICDLGSPPSSLTPNLDIRAKFQLVWQTGKIETSKLLARPANDRDEMRKSTAGCLIFTLGLVIASERGSEPGIEFCIENEKNEPLLVFFMSRFRKQGKSSI